LILEFERLGKKSYDLSRKHPFIHWNDLSPQEQKNYNSTAKYPNCNCEFTKEAKRCIHHDHITGKYISVMCSNCNISVKYERVLPIYAHNLKCYDSHFIVPALAKYGSFDADITCIPNNEEKYISFSKKITVGTYKPKDKPDEKQVKYELRFLDSFAFMGTSIDKLCNNLKKGITDINDQRKVFKNISKQFPDDEQFKCMISKGIYPYDYITDYSVLTEKKLPQRKHFYPKLTNTECKVEDHERAKKFGNCSSVIYYWIITTFT
jgi:hypothetical protein